MLSTGPSAISRALELASYISVVPKIQHTVLTILFYAAFKSYFSWLHISRVRRVNFIKRACLLSREQNMSMTLTSGFRRWGQWMPEENWRKADICRFSVFSRSCPTSRIRFLRRFAATAAQRVSQPHASVLTTEHSSFILISRSRNRIVVLEPQAKMF